MLAFLKPVNWSPRRLAFTQAVFKGVRVYGATPGYLSGVGRSLNTSAVFLFLLLSKFCWVVILYAFYKPDSSTRRIYRRTWQSPTLHPSPRTHFLSRTAGLDGLRWNERSPAQPFGLARRQIDAGMKNRALRVLSLVFAVSSG